MILSAMKAVASLTFDAVVGTVCWALDCSRAADELWAESGRKRLVDKEAEEEVGEPRSLYLGPFAHLEQYTDDIPFCMPNPEWTLSGPGSWKLPDFDAPVSSPAAPQPPAAGVGPLAPSTASDVEPGGIQLSREDLLGASSFLYAYALNLGDYGGYKCTELADTLRSAADAMK